MNQFTLEMLLPLGLVAAAIAIAIIGAKGLEAIGRQPEAANRIQINMILAIAFAEGIGILTFVIALVMINKY